MSSQPERTLMEVEVYALRLLDELGRHILGASLLSRGWTFQFDRARVRLGCCVFKRHRVFVRTISVSLFHARAGVTPDVEDTIRHEIAHALDFELRGKSAHDARWKALATQCGAIPKARSGERVRDDAAPWRVSCASCAYTVPLYRRPTRRYTCPVCRSLPLAVISRDGTEATQRTWQAVCPMCGTLFFRSRKPSHPVACKSCCSHHNRGQFDPRFGLHFTFLS